MQSKQSKFQPRFSLIRKKNYWQVGCEGVGNEYFLTFDEAVAYIFWANKKIKMLEERKMKMN